MIKKLFIVAIVVLCCMSCANQKFTKADILRWKAAGDVAANAFMQMKYDKETDFLHKNSVDEQVMYDSLYSMYSYYAKIDSVKVQGVNDSIYRQIAFNLKNNYDNFIYGGALAFDKKEYTKALNFFEAYWNTPSMQVFKLKKNDNLRIDTRDESFQTVKYYAAIVSLQTNDNTHSINLLQRIISEGYIENETYKESDIYELLVDKYSQVGDSLNFMQTLNQCVSKFPNNRYFLANLINEYISNGKLDDAIKYLDKAIKNKVADVCELTSVKANIFVSEKDYDNASEAYMAALNENPDCERALDGLGTLYILQAQDVKENAFTIDDRDISYLIEPSDYYRKSLPHLEKYRELLIARNADPVEIRLALVKLRNAYYNLNMLVEFDNCEKELNKYTD
ncbi:lipopolysaccharide assembly protein LapB [Dysgonomonas sp. 520]|uniref:tetratricopeptide repeat protein n=1 Tax=Dysgonomonas sp. 520 TaxID=2302931 RepID=UPI0013D79489|nr:hypothetical protein [Dysgonomonas sp. 520]NDW09950.1 hypothetical protein [Dysgonomonas sp. 520]